jgi:hypothetical protein
MRLWLAIVVIGIVGTQKSARGMCPFCPPASVTLSEQVAGADAVALVSWVKAIPAKTDEEALASTTFEVVSPLKDFGETLKKGSTLSIPEHIAGNAGNLFLLLGNTEGRDSLVLIWDTPQPISEIGFYYIKQAPVPESPRDKRLRYFLKFLEYPDPLLADDAYAEFAGADYEDLLLIKEAFSREKLRKWIEEPKTLASRLGLYGLMLGLCGNAEDAELLESKIQDEADVTRLGIDGIIGGYLLLTGEQGMQVLEESKIKNPKAPVADVHSAMSAFRFLWQYGHGVIPKDRLRSAVRLLVDRPEVADLAIADLSRWKDWTLQDRLMEIYKTGDPNNPLGEISVRQAVIRYMIASTLDKPETGDPPPHVIQGRKHLETLRELDPKTVERSERLMLPR